MQVRSARLGLVAVVAILGATGCSSGSSQAETPQVASLIPSSAAAPGPTTPKPERPRQRLDETDADYQVLLKPYKSCMKAHGRTNDKEQGGWASGEDVPPEQAAAQKACQNFWPLPPWELDPANPEAKDFARAVVKCLKGKGVKYVETTDDGIGIAAGGPKNDEGSITRTGEFLDDCQREVAARK
jgi:hypothetical protein